MNAILDKSSPHLKYATYGSLGASVLSYSLDDSFYRASSLRVEIFTDDFKDISLVLLGVNSNGNTYSKDIPLYSNSEVPSFSYSSKYSKGNDSTSVVSNLDKRSVLFTFQTRSVAEIVASVNQDLTSTLTGFANIIISQYGKIASIPFFLASMPRPKRLNLTDDSSF